MHARQHQIIKASCKKQRRIVMFTSVIRSLMNFPWFTCAFFVPWRSIWLAHAYLKDYSNRKVLGIENTIVRESNGIFLFKFKGFT